MFLLEFNTGDYSEYWDEYYQVLQTENNGIANVYKEVLERTSSYWGIGLVEKWPEDKKPEIRYDSYQHICTPLTEEEMLKSIKEFYKKERRFLGQIESVLGEGG